MQSYLAAVVQLGCSSDAEANLQRAEALVTEAAGAGARLIATPENTNFLGRHEEKARRAEPMDGPTCTRFAALARRLRIHLLLGSFNEIGPSPQRCYNTSVLFDPEGNILATYRKMHLFDVDISDQVRFLESDTVIPGNRPALVKTELGRLGLSICYDLRFPELYRHLAARGAEILTIPSAFTMTTGRDHWEPLMRARAIENQCYVLAPAQWGHHDDEGLRESYGHAMIVDPWGQVIASVPDGTGYAIAHVDHARLQRVRASMPVTQHRRLSITPPGRKS